MPARAFRSNVRCRTDRRRRREASFIAPAGSPMPSFRPDASERCRSARLAAVAAVLLALHGCASMTQQSATSVPFDVPAGWSVADVSAQNGTASLAQWWQRFDDPLLAQLIDQAMQANTSVTSAEAAVRQARALRDVAAAALLPSVSAARPPRSAAARAASATPTASAPASMRAGSSTSSAKTEARLNASEAALGASDATLGDVQVSIAAEVALDYITLRGLAGAPGDRPGQPRDASSKRCRSRSGALQAGLATSLDAEQARASTEQTRALLPALQTSIEQTRHALAVLTGQPPGGVGDDAGGIRPDSEGARHARHPLSRGNAAPARRRARGGIPGHGRHRARGAGRCGALSVASNSAERSASRRPRWARSRAARRSSPPSWPTCRCPSSKAAPSSPRCARSRRRSTRPAPLPGDGADGAEGCRRRARRARGRPRPPRAPAARRRSRRQRFAARAPALQHRTRRFPDGARHAAHAAHHAGRRGQRQHRSGRRSRPPVQGARWRMESRDSDAARAASNEHRRSLARS